MRSNQLSRAVRPDSESGKSKQESGGRGRRRRRRGRPEQAPAGAAPAKVVVQAATARPALDQSKHIEEPLTESELRVMAQHLRFLREHRKVLNLKVNAHEDLLLNEARVPTRRGVCQHLLSKVDRARVLGAAQRLPPPAATRLAEGVLRISPDVDYLLLYLDCVRRSASQEQATSALSEALGRIDFSSVSAAQLRRVLDLIVELFEVRQRVPVLLGLLGGSAFRDAVDGSAGDLPQGLRELVMPLRAVRTVVVEGRPGRFDAELLQRGVSLLLDADERTLQAHPPAARRRLLQAGLQLEPGLLAAPGIARSLRLLLDGIDDDGREQGQLGMALARAFVAAGLEPEARRLLESLAARYPDFRQPSRWLSALAAPRWGRVALTEAPRRRRGRDSEVQETLPSEAPALRTRALPGVALDDMRRLSIVVAASSDDAEHRACRDLLAASALPGVAPLLHEGRNDDGKAWFAVPRIGRSLASALHRRHGLGREQAPRVAAEAAAIVATLADLGVTLPDLAAGRFELADDGRLWLVDLRGSARQPPEEARRLSCRALAELCASLLGADAAASDPLFERIAAAGTTTEIGRLLAPHLTSA